MSNETLLYYSTNTYLAFYIANSFYGKKHYVWCSPVYDPSKLAELDPRKRIPASSSPHKIYLTLLEDVTGKDLHSAKIESNKKGLKHGALMNLKNGIIDQEECDKIIGIIENAPWEYFTPLLYLIPRYLVETRIQKVHVTKMANPLSEEYLIVDLDISEFDIIQPQ